MKKNLFVGQPVWYKSTSIIRSYDITLKETKISKIGRKFFEVEDKWIGRFYIDTLKHDSGIYTSKYQAYLSVLDYENEMECNSIFRNIQQFFTNRNELTLSQLREIQKIIEQN